MRALLVILAIIAYKCSLVMGGVGVGGASQRRSLSFYNVRYHFSPDFFSNFSMEIRNGSMFADMYIKQVLKPGYKTNLDFQIRLKNSKKYQSLFVYDLDVCSMIVAYKDTIFKKWFRSFLRYGNFMENCPVSVGHYYLHGYRMDSSLVPSYLYPGDYRIKGYGFYGHYKRADEVFTVSVELDATIK